MHITHDEQPYCMVDTKNLSGIFGIITLFVVVVVAVIAAPMIAKKVEKFRS